MENITLTFTYEQYRTIAEALIHADVHMQGLHEDYIQRKFFACAKSLGESRDKVVASRAILKDAFETSLYK